MWFEHLQLDLFGVSWLGSIFIALGFLFVVIVVSIATKKTKDQMIGAKSLPKKKAENIKNTPKSEVTSVGEEYANVDAPTKNGKKRFQDRVAPLIFEKGKDGKWKMSLGRTSYWFTMPVFIAMCVLAMVSLDDVADVGQPLVNLYLGVLGMLFLTNLGLLAYNLGNKFTEPMSMFLAAWGGSFGRGVDLDETASTLSNIKDMVKDKNKEAEKKNKKPNEHLNKLDKQPLKKKDRPAEEPPKVGGPPPA